MSRRRVSQRNVTEGPEANVPVYDEASGEWLPYTKLDDELRAPAYRWFNGGSSMLAEPIAQPGAWNMQPAVRATDEAKILYKLRSRTVELNFADMKEHRGVRRFSCRGLQRAKNEAATTVLAHNLLYAYRATVKPQVAPDPAPNDQNVPLACPA